MEILEKAPAKINLSLDVLHKRKDGFHEVEMVMTTVDLADRIELSRLRSGAIRVESENRFVPNDERNLAYRAAKLMKDHYKIDKGVRIFIEKNIPVAAGLAGGSSDAAAVLRGVNKIWGIDASLNELAELGAKIGSDVSFCVYGGTALARGRGEQILELPSPPPCWVVLAKPTLGVSTQTIYQKLDPKTAFHPNTKGMMEALQQGDFDAICAHVGNALEGVTTKLHPEVNQIKEQMRQAGADAVLMSGSGPTVFALVGQEARAQRIYNSLKGFCTEVYMVRMLGSRDIT
ncbi:4-(cytidine 5'-diphospho)-2-C-methyl-D-erythritol kinase [Halobacillus shinanisalinarum]|uniref:4-diphosphocytidyl-2-C-methyl-D-erythritol kinase n=1 Tax=Halobacillus shinanisalinarum TaxID=2932258 RepID=A0ABY4GTY8_9BACI|nr:4-(cytidine 5'-diphospho)-2-C-methyl-D-erythritol kinase [Halobacillus shinanisalinarum]UOQ91350.1 4-(cytidine 5'-diphospho)-2-C-methyl-D-erythritol kinase [Halobacillus shinanisalinarum]